MTSDRKSPTMKDVARISNVSVQTVSAVINEKPGITDETRSRVLEAVEKTGYRPYSIARSLRTRQTKTIGLVISDISNPSFSSIASAAEDYAYSRGYTVTLYNTHDDIEREANYIQTASQRWVDGVIFVAAQDRVDGLQTLQEMGIPSVAIDRIPVGYDGPSVTLDNYAAGRMAAEHLLDLNHTCIGHISGPLRLRLARERLEGFQAAIRDHGLTPGPVVDLEGNWECETGYRAMQNILDREYRAGDSMPTAIFAANDRMAIGAMNAAYEAGLTVPEDLSVIGLDDIEVSAFQTPPLTTVRQSFTDLAVKSVKLLLSILKDEQHVKQTQIVLEPELILRRSTTRLSV